MPCTACGQGRKTAPRTFNIPVRTIVARPNTNGGGKGALFGSSVPTIIKKS